jgi:hypothetical protein
MQDIRVELGDEVPQRDRLAHEKGRRLEPAQRPRPEVLEDRAVGQVLPAPGEVAEAADLQRAGALTARRVVTPGREGRGNDERGRR